MSTSFFSDLDEPISKGSFFTDLDEAPKKTFFADIDQQPQELPWVLRSSDPNHPFKRTLKEHPGKFAGALTTGALGAIESFMRGGRQPGEFEGIPGAQQIERPSVENQMAVDALREKVYEGIDDEEIKDILEKAEILGGFLPAERVIFGAVAGIKKIGEFNKAIGNIAKSQGKSKFDVLGDLWNASKNYLKEKFKWPESKINAFEKGEVTVLKPEEAKELVDQSKKLEKEIIIPVEPKRKEVPAGEKEIQRGKEQKKPHELVTDFESLTPQQKEEYSSLLVDFSKRSLEKELKYMNDEAKLERAKIAQEIANLPYLNDYDKNRYMKDAQKHLDALSEHEKKRLKRETVVSPKLPSKTAKEKPIKVFYPLSKEQQSYLESLKDKHPVDLTTEEDYLLMLESDSLDKNYDSKSRIKDQKELKSKLNELVPKKKKPKEQRPLFKKIRPEGSPKTFVFKQPVMGKVQAAKRSDILKLFRKAFVDPIRLGKISQRSAAGIHKLWPRITRLLRDNDIESAAHEIGHNLHTILYRGDAKTPNEERINIGKALRPYLDELKPMALYEPWGMEGFAEFTRLYVTNPDLAKQSAPKFYGKFEADLEAQYPELKNALLEARDYYEQYLQGTPESRIRAQTDYGTDATFLENAIDWIKKHGNLDFLKTQFLDDVFPSKRLVAEAFGIPVVEVENLKDERNLYRSLRVLKGAIGKADVFMLHETFHPMTLKRIGRGLRQILRKLKTDEEYKEFNDYLIAARTIEKTEQEIETGISYGDAIYTERKLAPKYKRTAILFRSWLDAGLKYARDASLRGTGLISGEQYDLIKKNNLMYAPFQRTMDKEPTGRAATGGNIQAKKTIKRMKGSTRNIIAPVESAIKNMYSLIINAEKNLAGQILAKLSDMKGVGAFVERVPTPMGLKGKVSGEDVVKQWKKAAKGVLPEATDEFWKKLSQSMPDFFLRFGPGTYPAGENIVTVFQDGKPTYYEVSAEIYEMWTKGIAPYTADLITRILRIPARTLRAGAILNPKFMQKNFVRDTWGGFLFTRYGKEIKNPVDFAIDTFYTPLSMLATAARKQKLYVEFMKAGGGMSTMQSLDRNSVAKKVDEVRHGYKPYQIMKWLRLVAGISEEANRLAEFGRALEIEGYTRLGKEIAAFASRDLSIDFAKMGLQTKALNQIIPFFNATIQGGDKMIRQAMNPQTRAEFLARAVAFLALPSLILAWLNQDDDRVKEFYEEEKDFNFITFIGDTALKMPVPFETGVIMHGMTQRMFNYFINKDPHAFEGFMGSVVQAMMPNFLPSFVNPVIESMANKNFFTGAPIIPKAKESVIAKYQYKKGTSSTARLVGRAMTYMLGQDTRAKAASPAVIDHFINSWTGGLGRMIVGILDTSLEVAGLEEKVPGPEQTIVEKLGLDAFAARYPRANTRSIEKFYDNYADATARQKSIKLAEKEELETEEDIGKAYQRFEKLYDYSVLKRAYKSMQMSQRAINGVWNDPEIDKETKQKMVDDLYLQQIQFAKDANEQIELHQLAKKRPS